MSRDAGRAGGAPHAGVPPRWALVAAVLAVSTGAVLIRKAQASALTVAAWRSGLAALCFLPFGLPGLVGTWPRLTARERACAFGAGAFLAAHFAAWIESLSHTSVAASLLLVCTTPIWVALASPFVLGERVSARTWAGIGLATLGIAAVGIESGALLGNALALAGAVFAAGYLMCGRVVRAKLDLAPYAALCYGIAGLLLTLGCTFAGTDLVLAWPQARWVLLVVLLPQIVGHTSYNYALRHLGTAVVALVSLLEPLGSSLLAWAVLGEAPGARSLLGGALVLAGVALALAVPRADPRPS